MESKAAFIHAKKKVAQGTMANMFKIRSRAEWKRRLFATFLVTFSLLALVGNVGNGQVFWNNVGTVVAASQTGTATILGASSTVYVDNRTIASSFSPPAPWPTNVTGSAINVDTTYYFVAGVRDTGGLTDIAYVTTYLLWGTTTKNTFNVSIAYGFRWVRNGWGGSPLCPLPFPPSQGTGCWHELTGTNTWTDVTSGKATYLNVGSSSHTTISNTVKGAFWTFAAKVSKIALYTSAGASPKHWNYEVDMGNRAGDSTASRTGTFDVNLWLSMTVFTPISWGTVDPGQTKWPAPANPYNVNYGANAVMKLQISGSGDPQNQYGDTFPLANIYVGKTGNSDGVSLTTSPQDLYPTIYVTLTLNNPTYWYVTTPDPFPPGTYTFVYAINIDFNTYSN